MPIHTHQFDNGLVLLAEPMPWLESAAFTLLVPAGCSREPAELAGLGTLTCELAQRGSGSRDSRQFIEELELLGADFSSSVANAHASFGGAMPAENLSATLRIYADLVLKPHLNPAQLPDARLTCLQEVRAIEDDLAQRVMQTLRKRQYPDPYGRPSQGTEAGLESITISHLETFFAETYVPQGAILSVAGKLDWPQIRDEVGELFGGWRARPPATLREKPAERGHEHFPHESSQTHLALAFDSVSYAHPDYYFARAAVGVLSDGMSSRLFTEVREKRGLCYSVYAFCHSLHDRGSVLCYAGTTTERAQQTLDVLVAELHRLRDGITEQELARLKTKLKSSLILQQESSPSRSGAMASEWFHLGRVQTLDELGKIVDDLNVPAINAYLAEHPPRDFTLVSLGAKPLEWPAQ